VLSHRHEECCAQIQSSGNIDALCEALNECMIAKADPDPKLTRAWSDNVSLTIQTLVSRSIDAWQYCQEVMGIEGLFSLSVLGNTQIKNLCLSTMLNHSVNSETGGDFIQQLAEKDAISSLNQLLGDDSEDVIVNCLRLLKVLTVENQLFRTQALSPNHPFMKTITYLIKRNNSEIQGPVCVILDTICADNVHVLRMQLTEYNTIKDLIKLAEYSNDQALAATAAKTIANLTDTSESDFLVGSAPLSSTLSKSGILPTLRGLGT